MLRASRPIVIAVLIASLLSFFKFNHCRDSGWGSPDVYVHMCYSDISALYGAREINVDHWPYSSPDNSVEYPVLTGVVMWATGHLVGSPDGYRQYFDINIALLILLFLFSALLVWRIRPEFALLFPLAPAVIGSLYINWDLWAVAASLLSLYLFKERRLDYSAIALGVAIATKFFPIVLLFGIALHFIATKKKVAGIRYLLITSLTWVIINAPVALTTFDGWWRFYQMNIERSNDLGSFWYALSLLQLPQTNLNNLSIFLFVIALMGIGVFYFAVAPSRTPFENLATVAFISVAAFVTMSKVYSPQYVLWLTPLAVIAMTSKDERRAFWIWQGGEAIYHIAIWQYLASYSGAKFGLPENFYALSIFLRIATLAWFVATLIRTALAARSQAPHDAQGRLLGFLSDSTGGYA